MIQMRTEAIAYSYMEVTGHPEKSSQWMQNTVPGALCVLLGHLETG